MKADGRIRAFAWEVWNLYSQKRLARAAAAMSYHLTMTFFPLIICLYALFGQSYATAVRLLDYLRRFLTPDAADMIDGYLKYLSEEGGLTVTVIAVTILASSTSAAMRVLINTVNELQGQSRYKPAVNFLLGFVLALGMLAAFYFAFIVLLTGGSFVAFVEEKLPGRTPISDWTWARFLLLGALGFAALWGLFSVFKPRRSRAKALPGALLSTMAIVVMSWIFSMFIAVSSRYQLIYGSLASVILLMYWLFLTCRMILAGACVNAALNRVGQAGSQRR